MYKRCSSSRLQISTIDVESPTNNSADIDYVKPGSDSQSAMQRNGEDNLLQLKDIVPISLYATICIVGAILISTYEDFDVTHTRPNPSTLRLPTTSISISSSSGNEGRTSNSFNFWGAATKGMGWGHTNRGVDNEKSIDDKNDASSSSFEEWYGTSATTLQWKPSYNEIMLQHRSERVPRWERFETLSTTSTPLSTTTKSNNVAASKDQLQQAVLQLYKSLDELDELKTMADDYDWEGMKEHLRPTTNTLTADDTSKKEYALPMAMEYSMDVLKSMPSSYINSANNGNKGEVSELIGFDWGSCAWRHCGAKADAQEAIAELYNNVGMLEPFECRFIIGKCILCSCCVSFLCIICFLLNYIFSDLLSCYPSNHKNM